MDSEKICIFVLVPVLLTAAFIDLRKQRIPNWITFPCIIGSVIYSVSIGKGLYFGACGVATGIGLLLIPWLLGGMGAGDAKLMGAVGGFLGARDVVNAFFFIAIVGGVYAVVIGMLHRDKVKGSFYNIYQSALDFYFTGKIRIQKTLPAAEAPKLCYGLAIALGTFLYFFASKNGFKVI